MAAAAIAAASTSLSALQLASTLRASRTLRRRSLVRASSSSPPPSTSSSNREFSISFGAGRAKETLSTSESQVNQPRRLLIPWIIRGEDGNLKLSLTPPARFIHNVDHAKPASTVAKKKNKETKGALQSSEPKHSKAARRFYNEHFRESQRLSKVLAAAGVASRRSSEELIFDGRVTVNGSVCKIPQTRVDLYKDVIYVNGSRLPKKLPPKLYFALNKPKGYICSSGEESKSIISLFDEYWKSWKKANPGLPKARLFTVARLDVATTGLIIVTNDGDFAQRLAHPSSGLSKEYIATVEGTVSKRQLIAISNGVEIEGVHCIPESVELLPVQAGISRPRLRVVVHEGRNHEVRELVKNAGLQLHSLKRVRIGGFRLPSNLSLGQYVELKPADITSFGGKLRGSLSELKVVE